MIYTIVYKKTIEKYVRVEANSPQEARENSEQAIASDVIESPWEISCMISEKGVTVL